MKQYPTYRRRYRLNLKRFFTVISLTLLILFSAAYLLNIFMSGNGSEAHSNANEPTAVIYEPNQSTETTQITTEPPLRVISDDELSLLILINWENHGENKTPDNLTAMENVFLSDEVHVVNPAGSINIEAGQAASRMFKDAVSEGIGKYMITSAYRSYDYQQGLFNERLADDPDYGSDPYNTPVKCMPPYASEHTTGLALDILALSYDEADDGYVDTPEGIWLFENAYKYGFILRYPEDKEHITGVIFEPWHYRYVGETAALEMHEKDMCLEEYVLYLGI